MKTTAAVLVDVGRPLELAELTVPALRAGQVLVEVAASGVCHTQLLEARGYRGHDPYLPHLLGHEGSGTVLETGGEVARCRPGDRVIMSWMKASGADVPGCVYDWNGRPVNAGGVTTFQTHSVVSENRLTKLPDEIDFPAAALLGCAVATGAGAVCNTANLQRGQSVAVFGSGGIGLCAIAAAVLVGAHPVLAIDVNADRLRLAQQFGATQTIDAASSDPLEAIARLAPGGLDVAIEASGRPLVMQQALSAVRGRGGTVVVVGNARHGEHLQIDPRELNQGKRLLGTWGGDNQVDRDFPRYCQWLASGKLNIDALLSHTYPLSRINDALDDLEQGRVARPLIDLAGTTA